MISILYGIYSGIQAIFNFLHTGLTTVENYATWAYDQVHTLTQWVPTFVLPLCLVGLALAIISLVVKLL